MASCRIAGPLLGVVVFAFSILATAEPSKLAILPVGSDAGLDSDEQAVLYAALSEAAMEAGSGKLVLIPESKIGKAAKRKMDDVKAVALGKKVGADLVMTSTVRKLNGELRASVKVLKVDDGTVVGLGSAKASDIASLEKRLFPAAHRALETCVADAASSTPAQNSSPPQVALSFGDIKIDAIGEMKHKPKEGPVSVEADVYINGRRVGKTPFEDGLPPGVYLFEVKAYEQSATQELAVVAGELAEFTALFNIPKSPEELAIERRERDAAALAKRKEVQERWAQTHATWEVENAEVEKRRRPMIGVGATLMVIGPCLLITGIAFEVAAKREDDKYQDHKELWLNSADPSVIADEKSLMDAAANARDTNNGLGIASLVVGGASVITAIILLAKAPKKLQEPKKPTLSLNFKKLDLAVVPALGPEGGGLQMDLRF